MSLTVRDVRCPNGHYACGVYFKRTDGPPPCDVCGEPQTTFYATREQEGMEVANRTALLGEFRSVRIGGKTFETKEALDRYVGAYCEKQGLRRDEVYLESEGTSRQVNARCDDLKHEAHVTRRENGYDAQQTREHQRESHRR
jgi:hypothetical protein